MQETIEKSDHINNYQRRKIFKDIIYYISFIGFGICSLLTNVIDSSHNILIFGFTFTGIILIIISGYKIIDHINIKSNTIKFISILIHLIACLFLYSFLKEYFINDSIGINYKFIIDTFKNGLDLLVLEIKIQLLIL